MLSLKELIFVSIFGLTAAGCTTLSEPRLHPVAPSAREDQLLEQGRQLFSQGKYQIALRKAQQVLSLNPANVEALYSAALCRFEMQEYEKSVTIVRQAVNYRGDQLLNFYFLLGANYERLDDPWNALRTYRYATQRYPSNSLLHYRMAQTYLYLNKPEEAAEAFKSVLRLDAHNPQPHFQLGMLYAAHGYRTPALLALSTALLFEPVNGPVEIIYDKINSLLAGKIAKDSASKHAAIVIPKTDEGDFTEIDKALSEKRALLFRQGIETDSPAMIISQYQLLFEALSKMQHGVQAYFVLDFYVPFFQALSQKGLDNAAVYRLFQAKKDRTFKRWITSHPMQTKLLSDTIKNYTWPAAIPPN